MLPRPGQALPAVKVRISNPAVAIGAGRIVFPVTIESGQYIEYEGPADCRWHDERGAILRRITPQGDVPGCAGENPVRFTWIGPRGYNTRATVTIDHPGAAAGRNSVRNHPPRYPWNTNLR